MTNYTNNIESKKVHIKNVLIYFSLFVFSFSLPANAQDAGKTIDTRIGKPSFTHDFANGYPTAETQERLLDEMDFQCACQGYLWGLPIVSFAQFQHDFKTKLGAKNGQIVYVESYEDKLGIMTAITTTPYVVNFIDLTEGPWVMELIVLRVRHLGPFLETRRSGPRRTRKTNAGEFGDFPFPAG